MSPLAQQPGTITLSARGHLSSVEATSDPRIEQFVTTYVQGPQTPNRLPPAQAA